MRLVQVMVPTGKRQAVLSALDDEGVDYVVTDEASNRGYAAVVTFPLPTEAVEPVLERLREAGIERDAYTVVLDAETVISQRFDQLEERYEKTEEDTGRIAREELVARARDLAPRWWTFLVMTAISAVVATAGLLLDSPAIVVGSMVIAPLIGPAMAASVGSVVDDRDLFLRGLKLQVVGGVLAVVSAAVFAFVLRTTHVVPMEVADILAVGEVRERLFPDVLSLVVALGAGAAGAVSLSTGVSTALVGVMIAAALVPPTAVVGIGLAWGAPVAVLGSAVLVLVNYLSINFAALVVLWYKGFRPVRWFQWGEARSATFWRIAVLGWAILVLSAFLGGVTYATYQSSLFEEHVHDEVQSVVNQHEDLVVLSIDVEHEGVPLRHPRTVTVVLGYPPGTDPPPLASSFDRRIGQYTGGPISLVDGRDVDIEVRYVQVDTA